MREFFKHIITDKTIVLAFFINTFIVIVATIYILFFYGKLPPFIPIFNQLPWGDQRLGATPTIFIPVLVALLIILMNIFTAAFVYKRVPLISRMLAGISLLCGILMLLFIIKTVSLII